MQPHRRFKREFSSHPAENSVWHAPCTCVGMIAGWSGIKFRRHEMTHANLQQFAASIIGALFATTLFVTAAVGPVGQFI